MGGPTPILMWFMARKVWRLSRGDGLRSYGGYFKIFLYRERYLYSWTELSG
ncbi:MAG: hypothetical protein QXZ63_03810 [Sulfolobales archaeon]